jgi:hypothetical protein
VWAAGGAQGWSYLDVLPCFIRPEDIEHGADEYHGVGGPLHVADGCAVGLVVDSVGHSLTGSVDAADLEEGPGAVSARRARLNRMSGPATDS